MASIIVVGAGIGGLHAVEALRQAGYSGRLTLIGGEPDPPYDRPSLSKEVLDGSRPLTSVILRSVSDLVTLGIEVRLGTWVEALDLSDRIVTVKGERLRFDGLIIATGAFPRRITSCNQQDNVFVLRSLGDARVLTAALTDASNLLVVGGGVIGCEVAASARRRGVAVTIVEAAPVPMLRSVGREMGQVVADLHREHGTGVHCNTTITRITGERHVQRVHLSDGVILEPDVVVVGVGVRPATEWAARAGLTVKDGITCDAGLNTGHPAVFAVGDVARWPNALFGAEMRCEQWTNAVLQGRHAARNLLRGREAAQPFVCSNYFWSDQYGIRMQFAGVPAADEVRMVAGRIDAHKFVAWYRRGTRLSGALAFSSPKLFGQSKAMIEAQTGWDTALRRLAPRAADPRAGLAPAS